MLTVSKVYRFWLWLLNVVTCEMSVKRDEFLFSQSNGLFPVNFLAYKIGVKYLSKMLKVGLQNKLC